MDYGKIMTVIKYFAFLSLLVAVLDYCGAEFPTNYDFVRP